MNGHIAINVSVRTILVNIALAAFKLAAGILGASAAMVSDAVHTLSDVFSTIVVVIGVKAAARAPDREHPYGHERFECVAAIILAVLLAATGFGIGYSGLESVIDGNYSAADTPGLIALIAALVSIAVKECMYWYTRAAAKRISSSALMADAWHHRSDALSSIGSLIGILGARLGFPMLDPLACIVICVFIVKAALNIFLDAVGKMTDKACDDETEERIRGLILNQEGVDGIDLLRTRMFGDRIYVDVEISVDGELTLGDSHEAAHRVHDAIEGEFPSVKHCMVHVNPLRSEAE